MSLDEDTDKICEILKQGGSIYLNPCDYSKIVSICIESGLERTIKHLLKSEMIPAGTMVVHAG